MNQKTTRLTPSALVELWHGPCGLKRKFDQWLWMSPGEDHNAASSALRSVFRVIFIAVMECSRSKITLRASSLTFTVVLSLVPTLALGTAVLKGLGAGNQMRNAAYRFIEQLERTSDTFSPTPPDDPAHDMSLESSPPPDPSPLSAESGTADGETMTPDAAETSITGHLRRAVDTIFDYVERTDFATLGAFGIFGLVLAVLSVLGNIERSMNAIWKVESNRPFGRKIIDYLALLVLLPVTVNLTLATEATIRSPALQERLAIILPGQWLPNLLLNFMPILIVLATFTLFYRFLPNTRVRMAPALIGGLVGGIGWFFVQGTYIRLQLDVARYNAIYGSFATLPLFLFWIYMGWLVFLAGAEVSFACQVWQQYFPGSGRLSPLRRIALSFDTLNAILQTFRQRQLITQRNLARRLHCQEGHIKDVVDDLERSGLIRRLREGGEEGFLPVAPGGELRSEELVRMVLCGNDPSAGEHRMAQAVLQAAERAVAGPEFSLADQPCIPSMPSETTSPT